MSVLLVTKKEVQFVLNETFQISHLAPIGEFVQWKLIHDWDDYNELFHAAKLVQQIAKIENVWLHTHTLTKRNNCLLYTSPSPRDQRGSRMPSSA